MAFLKKLILFFMMLVPNTGLLFAADPGPSDYDSIKERMNALFLQASELNAEMNNKSWQQRYEVPLWKSNESERRQALLNRVSNLQEHQDPYVFKLLRDVIECHLKDIERRLMGFDGKKPLSSAESEAKVLSNPNLLFGLYYLESKLGGLKARVQDVGHRASNNSNNKASKLTNTLCNANSVNQDVYKSFKKYNGGVFGCFMKFALKMVGLR